MSAGGQLPRLTPVDFPTLGWQILHFAETFIRHGPGPVIGERWVDSPHEPGLGIDDEEALHICWCYRLRPDTGRRVFRRVIRVRPKGRRKSEIAGLLSVIEAIGPCRFSHWAEAGEVSWWGYEYEEGEPVGKPLAWPVIRALATEEDQTGNTYDNTYEMLRGPEVEEAWPGLDVGLTRTNLPAGGEITPSTGAADSKEGGKESFGAADETYLWHTAKLKNQHRMVTRNLAKIKANDGWMYETSNAHKPGQGSVLERAYEHGRKLGTLDAMVKAGILVDWREPADPLTGNDFKNDRKVLAALRDLYGPASDWMDLDRILAEIRDPEATEDDSRRAWLNMAVSGGSQWLNLADWRALGRPKLKIIKLEPLAVGFDGSRFNDATGIVVCTEAGVITPWRWWEKKVDDPDDWEVDQDEVDQAVDDLFREHPIARMLCDPFFWETNVANWARKHGPAVRPWRTNRPRQMAYELQAFESAVRAGTPRHTQSDVLNRHIGNTHVQDVPSIVLDDRGQVGHKLVKERKGSPNKIDLSLCTVLAWTAHTEAIAKNEYKTARRRSKRRFIPLSD